MRIVLASRNEGKLNELRQMFRELPITLESQADHNVPSPEETGSTFIENALLKAKAVCLATGQPAIADDSGLVVPALNGAPGIFSARYAGEHGDDISNNEKLIQTLQNVNNRSAHFYCAMVFMLHAKDPSPMVAFGTWHGEIVEHPAGENGFGYDPHFFLPDKGVTSAQLEPFVKNTISHRGQAAGSLLTQLTHLF